MAKTLAQKEWYKIEAPDIFDNKELSETPAEESKRLKGRTVKIGLKKLMKATNKYYMDVFLKINNVKGERASTKLVGHKCSREYISRLVRRQSNRIDVVEDINTKDEKEVRVKLIAVTLKKVNSSVEKKVRNKIIETVKEIAEEEDFEEFMNSIFKNEIQKEIYEKVKKIYPLRTVEFRKTELI